MKSILGLYRRTPCRDYRFLLKNFLRTQNTSSSANKYDSILDRTLDKQHRLFYHSLERERIRYGKSYIEIRPTMKFLLFQLQRESEGKVDDLRLSEHYFSNSFKLCDALEPSVFHIFLSLHYISRGYKDGLNERHQSMIVSQREHVSKLAQILLKKAGMKSVSNIEMIKKSVEIKSQLMVEELTDHVLLSFNYNKVRVPTFLIESLQYGLICYLIIMGNSSSNTSSSKEKLVTWIKTISAPNITVSCQSLTNASDVPAFLLSDIVLRTPMSRYEFHLQSEMWNKHIADIGIAYHRKYKHLKLCIDNLLFYAVQYDPKDISKMLERTLSFFQTEDHGYKFKLIDPELINAIIWRLALYKLESSSTDPNTSFEIIRAQEILVRHLSRLGDPGIKVHFKLDVQGYMGIILVVFDISKSKADKLLKVASTKVLNKEKMNIKKECFPYYFTTVCISKTPDLLLHNFNRTVSIYPNSATLWFAFIKRFQDMGLLNEDRSKKILKELVKRDKDILITKNIILLLLNSMTSLNSFFEFISILQKDKDRKDKHLIMTHRSSIVSKYLSMIYQCVNLDKTNTIEVFRSQRHRFHELYDMLCLDQLEKSDKVLIDANPLEYARLIYRNCFRKKTPRVVGIMLNGEVNQQPLKLYDLYKEELFVKGNLIPDESCVTSLLRAAMACDSRKEHLYYLWDGLDASYVAIHEFKTHVIKALNNDSLYFRENKIYPNDDLWQRYISLLAKYGYLMELSQIIEWWFNLNFKPKFATLLMLLSTFPPAHSERYIKHVEKLRFDSSKTFLSHREESLPQNSKDILRWPWPTVEELKKFTDAKKQTTLLTCK